jgi:hypothetical protein
MTDMLSYEVLALVLVGSLALYLIFRFPGQRWPRPLAVTAAGAILAIFLGEAGAVPAILITGVVLTVGAASEAAGSDSDKS